MWLLLGMLAVAPTIAQAKAPDLVVQAVQDGWPDPNRSWTSADYGVAQQKVQAGSPWALPRYGQPGMDAVFRRMVHADSWVIAKSPGRSTYEQVQEVIAILTSVTPMLEVYVGAANAGAAVQQELLDMMLFVLVGLDAQWVTTEALLAERAVPLEASQQAGLEQMRSGTATSLSGAVTTLTEVGFYGKPRLTVYASGLVPLVAPLLPRIAESSRVELQHRVAALATAETDPAFRASLEQLAAALAAR